jgi:hypothetical protein
MRIWDIEPERLCDRHLLAEHAELHGLWNTLTQNKKGYANHPETRRWRGKLRALYNRHGKLVKEMTKRSFNHNSPLDPKLATGKSRQTEYVDTPEEQRRILKTKDCDCLL